MSNYKKVLSKGQELKYIELCKNGDENARSKLMEHNFKLVRHIAQKYINSGIGLEDLESIGKIGLIKAVDTYNADRNAKLSTYAATCIENEIKMELRKTKVVTVSFDDLLSITVNGDDLRYEDTIYDENVNIVSEYEDKEQNNILRKIVMSLPDRDRDMVIKYFGFDNNIRMTQQEIADLLGISQSYVCKQIKRIVKEIENKLKQIELVNNELLLSEEIISMEYERTSACVDLKAQKNKIEILVTKLTEEEKRLFKLRYGTDYENDVEEINWTSEDYINFKYHLHPKLKELLKTIKINRTSSLRNKLKCTEVELNKILSKLNETETALLRLNCGTDLEHPKRSEYCSKNNKEQFENVLLPHMKKLLKEIRRENKNNERENIKDAPKNNPLGEGNIEQNQKCKKRELITPLPKRLDCTKEQIIGIISSTDFTDEERILFNRANGEDLDNPKRSADFNREDELNYESYLVLKIKRRVNKLKKIGESKRKGKPIIPLPKRLGCTKEQIIEIISSADFTDEERSLFNKANGEDLDNPKRSADFNIEDGINYNSYLVIKIKRRVNKLKTIGENKKKRQPITSLPKRLDCTKEQITEVISSTDFTDEERKIFNKANGEDLDNPKREVKLSKEEHYIYYKKILPRLEKKILKHQGKNINECSTITPLPKKFECPKELISQIIETADFTEEERSLFNKANGEDLDNPKREVKLSKEENAKYYGTILPKLSIRICKKKSEIKSKCNTVTSLNEKSESSIGQVEKIVATSDFIGGNISTFNKSNEEDIENSKRNMNILNQPIENEQSKPNQEKKQIISIDLEKYIKVDNNESNNDNIKEDYIKISEALKTPTFNEMVRRFSPKDAIVVYLSFGYIDGKYYSSDAISNFFGIEKQEVIEIIKNALLLYRNKIVKSVDDQIEKVVHQLNETSEIEGKLPYQKTDNKN